ncbi:hypothetical protein BaRGS_00015408 [Batillaria attramentaria]|uniref:SMB domain-containing protein n=1 Tax=Batillaria attramentaria TaxID=370345 RepID=A0ABD0L1L6_9CAEN
MLTVQQASFINTTSTVSVSPALEFGKKVEFSDETGPEEGEMVSDSYGHTFYTRDQTTPMAEDFDSAVTEFERKLEFFFPLRAEEREMIFVSNSRTYYTWDKTNQTAEDFVTGFGQKTCAEQSSKAPKVISTTCRSVDGFPCNCTKDCDPYGFCCYDHSAGGGLTKSWLETTGCLEDQTYAMARCPQSWGEGDIREACETGQGKYTVDEPVTDLSTNVTFRNAFCAQCHNVTSFTPWELTVTCFHFQNVYLAESEEELFDLSRGSESACYVRRVPPAAAGPQRQCPTPAWFSAVVDTCNVTGECATEDYDADVEENCLLYKSLSLRVYQRPFTYQNLFCAVCNGVRLYTYRCNSKNGRGTAKVGDPPLTLLLGLGDRDTDSDDEHRLDTCSDRQWADLTVST